MINIIQSDLVEDIEAIFLVINEVTPPAVVAEEHTRILIDADGCEWPLLLYIVVSAFMCNTSYFLSIQLSHLVFLEMHTNM